MQVTVARRPRSPSVGLADPEHRSRRRSAWRAVASWVGGVTSLIAFGLRSRQLGTPSLWYDEGVSWTVARLPLPQLLAHLAGADFNPPLYFAVLHYWLPAVGKSEFALRAFSVIAGTLVVPLCWVLARRLFQSCSTATVAAILAATSVFLIDFSQEARGYALAAALGTLAVYALLRLLDSPAPRPTGRWWWTYTLAVTAALYTHYAMLLLMPAHLPVVARRRQYWPAVGMAWLTVAVVYLPWLPALRQQLMAMRAAPDFWVGRVAPTLAPERVLAAIAVAPGALPHQANLLLVGGSVLCVLAALAALVGPAPSKAAALLPLFLVVFPLTEAALLTALFPKFIDRYLLPISPFAYVALAGIAALARAGWTGWGGRQPANFRPLPVRPAAFLLTGCVALVATAHAVLHAPHGAMEIKDGDTRAAVAFITAHARPGDAVLLAQDTGPVFSYYYDGALGGRGVGWFGVVPEFSRGDDIPALAAALNTAAHGHSRLWLLLWHENFADPTDYLRNALDVGATRLLTYTGAKGYDLRLYQLRPGTVFSPRAAPLQPMTVRFGPHITFLGVGLEAGSRPANVPFVVHTWFRTDAPLDRDYQAVLRLTRDGHVWQQLALRPSRYTYPAQHWLPGVDVPGKLDFTAGSEVPPGHYHLTLSLYDPLARHDLSAVDAAHGAIGTQVDLGVVTVLPATTLGVPTPPEHVLNRPIGAGLLLWGSGALPAHLQQGARVDVTLLWRATGPPLADYQAQVALLPSVAAARPVPLTGYAPPAPGFRTERWPAGTAFKDIRTLQLPPRVPVGPATLALRVRTLDHGGAPAIVPLATMIVDPRPRDMTAPPDVGTPVGALFGEAAFLAGMQLDTTAAKPGGRVEVTLYWQCRGVLDQDYKVFVHFLDSANAIGGRQHDGPPNDGADPTTSWIPHQWIVDRHSVPIPAATPPGTYRIEVGLYRLNGAQFIRLPLASGGNAVIAGTVTIR